MNRDKVVEEVNERLSALAGFRRSEVLDEVTRKEIMERERASEKNAREEGLMAVYNEGLWATLRREIQIAMVLDGDAEVITKCKNLLTLHDQKGRKLGEWVNEKQAEELCKRPDVRFMGKDFVFYANTEFEGEPYFVLPEVDFPYLEGVKGIKNVTSCSPSGLVDEYIRQLFAFTDPGYMTHIVGFDIRIDTPAD